MFIHYCNAIWLTTHNCIYCFAGMTDIRYILLAGMTLLYIAGAQTHSLPVWDDIFTPTISSPPPPTIFSPLIINDENNYCSQVSLNSIMFFYIRNHFFILPMAFQKFSLIDCVDLIPSQDVSIWNTKFQQQRGYHAWIQQLPKVSWGKYKYIYREKGRERL